MSPTSRDPNIIKKAEALGVSEKDDIAYGIPWCL
jgi:hypothetical protein